MLLLVYLRLLLRSPAQKAAGRPGRYQLHGAAHGVFQLERPVLPELSVAVHRERLPLHQHRVRSPVRPLHGHPHRHSLHPVHLHPAAGHPPPVGPAAQPPVQDHPLHLHHAHHHAGGLCVQAHQGIRPDPRDPGLLHVPGGHRGVEPPELRLPPPGGGEGAGEPGGRRHRPGQPRPAYQLQPGRRPHLCQSALPQAGGGHPGGGGLPGGDAQRKRPLELLHQRAALRVPQQTDRG